MTSTRLLRFFCIVAVTGGSYATYLMACENNTPIGPTKPAPLKITTTSLSAATAGVPYADTLHATGGLGAYHWAATDEFPSWLSVSPQGILTGTPPASADTSKDTLALVVVDTAADTVVGNFTLTVYPSGAALTITTTSPLPQATAGTAYSEQFTATGGTGSYTWYPVSIPAGLSLSAGGLLSGTPTSADVGTPSVQLQVTSGSTTINGTFSLPVAAASSGSCTVTSPTAAVPTIHDSTQAPFYTFNTTCGAIGYTNWSLSAGALPTGVAINTTGTLTGMASGIPVINGPQRTTYSFTLSVTGTQGPTGPSQTGTGAFTVQGSPFFISGIQGLPAIPNFTVGTAYSYQFVDKNGFGSAYDTWSISNNPTWLSISSSGLLTGTPPSGSGSGAVTFTVQVITAKSGVADTVSDNVNWYPN